jgi:hypothetical protein
MRAWTVAIVCLLVQPPCASADVASVTITSRSVVADGHAFGKTGSYEKLIGRIEFAIDPNDRHNTRIADLAFAPRDTDGRVRFSSDLMVLQPTDRAQANGILLFELANRGIKALLPFFNRAAGSISPSSLADFGDGLLMRDGYTVVWVGWEADVPAAALRIVPPAAVLPPTEKIEALDVDVIVNARTPEAFLVDDPVRPPVVYPPADPASAGDRLTVRDRFWDEPTVIARERWRFVSGDSAPPKIQLDGGFDPGRWYRVSYRPTRAVVAGVGLAAIRDAAAAFRYRSDLPCAAVPRMPTASRSLAASCVSSCTTASTRTSRTGGCSMRCGPTSQARRADRTTSDSPRRATAICSDRRAFRLPMQTKPTPTACMEGCSRHIAPSRGPRSFTRTRPSSTGAAGGRRRSPTRASTAPGISHSPTTCGCISCRARSTWSPPFLRSGLPRRVRSIPTLGATVRN